MEMKNKMAAADSGRRLLRHSVATLAYWGGKALRDAPNGFAEFRVAEKTRTSGQILAHLGDLAAAVGEGCTAPLHRSSGMRRLPGF